jgi:hypothetical protein
MTGVESDSTDRIHEALARLRAYMRYAHRGEDLFPVEDPPETIEDAVTHGKELLDELRRVMWKHRLSFISHFYRRKCFTVVIFYWCGHDTEWISIRFPLHIPTAWWTIPPAIAGRWHLAQGLLAFLGVTQSKTYETKLQALIDIELDEAASVPSFEEEKAWDLEGQPEEG